MALLDPDLLKRVDRVASAVATAGARATRPVRHRAKTSRPLVVRPGGMGDLIHACIAFESMGIDPVDVDWLIERRSAVWAQWRGLPAVYYDAGMLAATKALWGRHPVVVNTEQLFGLSMALAEIAVARGGSLVSFETNRAARAADARVPYDPYDMPEWQAFRDLFEAALPAMPRSLPPITPGERRDGDSGRTVVALGGVHAQSRDLPAERWLQWIDGVTDGASDLDLVYGPGERQLAERLMSLAGTRFVDRSGNFASVVDTIRAAHRVLTIDGGMVHVAAYFGVPTDVIFTAGRDRKWAPLSAGSRVFARTDLPCRPCTVWGQVPPCPRAYECTKLDERTTVRTVAGRV
ncbi:glycosyltransferase family 9 protein [Catellatospora citrea]|nr:glycosyltransferase family 9 protein [Catellatospora citrea]